jgi:hypothetical protein
LRQISKDDQPDSAKIRQPPWKFPPQAYEQACCQPRYYGKDKDQGLSRSNNAASIIGRACAQDEQDQGQDGECHLDVLSIDFLREEEEMSDFVFHEAPLQWSMSIAYNQAGSKGGSKIASKD